MENEIQKEIEEILLPFVQAINIDVLECHVRRNGRMIAVQIIADKEHGGITVHECAQINKFVDKEIQERQCIYGPYTVEVASPGIDRPLVTVKDFQRVLGREVRFLLKELLKEKNEFCGFIRVVSENEVLIETSGQQIPIPYRIILKAKQII